MLVETDWEALEEARSADFAVYYGDGTTSIAPEG
jgi:hypothetical protein